MTSTTLNAPTTLPADWRDFFALTKPRVMTLVVFTGLCGLLVAPAPIHPVLGFTAILCIALGAGAAAALNMWYEADLDALMKRTASRPLPAGRMDRQTALHFGVGLGFFSVLLMGVATNWLAAAILAVSILFYVLVYTIWLKRRTPQNIVIGGAAGAFPPLIGWAAATGDVAAAAAHAVRAHLPVDAAAFLGAVAVRPQRIMPRPACRCCRSWPGAKATRLQILLYTLPMAAAAVAPWPLGLAGPLYGLAAARPRHSPSWCFRLRVARQQGDRAGRDEARKAAVRLLDPLSVRDVRRAGRRPLADRMTAPDEDEIRRRQRSRAIIMAVLLGLFVVLVYAITIAKMGLAS